MSAITPSTAPNLVLAPVEYDRRHQEQLTNQLRLYFNTLDASNRSLITASSSADTLLWLGWGGC